MMRANTYLISSNLCCFPHKNHHHHHQGASLRPLRHGNTNQHLPPLRAKTPLRHHFHRKAQNLISSLLFHEKGPQPHLLQICYSSLETKNAGDQFAEKVVEVQEEEDGVDNGGAGGGGGEERDWTTSILLFVFWGGLLYYVFLLAPDQTPSMDKYLLQKLLNLKGDDGFQVNQVLTALWYIMGLWPLLYSMLLIPSARSSKSSSVPVWPFVILACFLGAYVLIPYFVLWRPPPPPVEETELRKWPLSFLESKLTAGITLAAGLGLVVYAGLADGNVWREFYQFFGGSKLIHITSIDFSLLSAFAPFWVYNDMTVRKWYDKGFWLLPVSVIPFLGPALYVLLRPSLSQVTPVTLEET